MTKIILSLLYRDGANNKTFFSVKVDSVIYPKVNEIKAEEALEMGTFGVPTQNQFFNSETHPFKYDFDLDHNLVEVVKIIEEDAVTPEHHLAPEWVD